ncbi:polysaccharide deacetylase family protein [bacterium]|nr:polysaccharide deacetylase family protein [bacterium]
MNQLSLITLLILTSLSFARKSPDRQLFTDSNLVISTPLWLNDAKGAYSLSFDDGFLSHYEIVFPLLTKYGFKGTFYIVTNSLVEKDQPYVWRTGSWPQFEEILKAGHEIGSHTVTHPDLTKINKDSMQREIIESKQSIINHLKVEPKSFSYPYTTFNKEVLAEISKHHNTARSIGPSNNANDSNDLSLASTGFEYSEDRNIHNDTWVMEEVQNSIDNNIIQSRAWGILLAHEVLPLETINASPTSYKPISQETFILFLEGLKERQEMGQLWIETVSNIAEYRKYRRSIKLSSQKNENTYVFSKTTPLSTIQPESLTYRIKRKNQDHKIFIKLNKDWEELKFNRRGETLINLDPSSKKIEIQIK